jgi:hypothetical protein
MTKNDGGPAFPQCSYKKLSAVLDVMNLQNGRKEINNLLAAVAAHVKGE